MKTPSKEQGERRRFPKRCLGLYSFALVFEFACNGRLVHKERERERERERKRDRKGVERGIERDGWRERGRERGIERHYLDDVANRESLSLSLCERARAFVY